MSRLPMRVRLIVPSTLASTIKREAAAVRHLRDGVITGQGGLRAGIDQQDALPGFRQQRREIGGQGGLAHPDFR